MNKVGSSIGTRIKITYLDQNSSFESILPRKGIITRQLITEDNHADWFLVKLDDPFDYLMKNLQHSDSLHYLHSDYLLIRSRWKDNQIGETEPTSVFIFLVLDDVSLKKEAINLKEFYHVAWGMCYTEK